MKRSFFFRPDTWLAAMLLLVVPACQTDLQERENFAPYAPADITANGGQYKTFLLTAATEIAVPAPAAVTDAAYQRELQAIIDGQKALSDEQRRAVQYWNGGAVIRWNQVLRELVAKYNLPPTPNADGSYAFPNADSTRNNPLYYPAFPFSNPPFAARAYAYVALAQHDALVAAWHYKFAYGRPAPAQTNAAIQRLVPTAAGLPSYPSEDATLAGVTADMLKMLFPGEIPYLNALAEQQRNAARWAGKATASDVTAGDALGKAVAAKFMARARTDKTGAAVANAAYWKDLEDRTRATGETPWISLETPKRPPMLPRFGEVRSFVLTPETITRLRPLAPPSTNSEQFRRETEEVYQFSKNLTRAQQASVHFWADGAGTYTPPGHWNAIAADLANQAQLSEVATARVFALLNNALFDAAVCCWDTKYFYFNPRPSQVDPRIKTSTGVPNFPAFTSGHSTFSGAAATVLGSFFPAENQRLTELAKQASDSRMLGAIHYRSDCEVGLQCGINIGRETLNWAK